MGYRASYRAAVDRAAHRCPELCATRAPFATRVSATQDPDARVGCRRRALLCYRPVVMRLGLAMVVVCGACVGTVGIDDPPSRRDAGDTPGRDAGPGGRRDAGASDDDAGPVTPGVDAGRRDAGGPVRRDAGPSPTECASGPLALPIPGCMPRPVPDTGDPYADCVARINQFRWECQCMPPLARWTEAESCADQHAEYDSTRSPHSGFRDGICSMGGFGQNECPGWPSVDSTISGCLQAMWDEGPGEPFSEHGHYLNMTNTSFSMVACGFYTTPGGDVWAVQNFR